MSGKWKRLLCDVIIIIITGILVAVVINELRFDGIPLLPLYLDYSSYNKMSLSEFRQDVFKNDGAFIFDARPHEFYEKSHLAGAVNFPVSEFDFFYSLYLSGVSCDVPIFVCGRTLSRAYDLELAHRLGLKGHKNVTILK